MSLPVMPSLKDSLIVKKALLFLFLLLSLGCVYLFISDLVARVASNQVDLYHKYIELNKQKQNLSQSFDKRIQVAEIRAEKTLSIASYVYPFPSYFAASGRFYFAKAMQQTQIKERLKWLEQSHSYWVKAHKARPYWPYYLLPLLQVEIVMEKPKVELQKRMSELLEVGKNETALALPAHQVFIKHWSLFSEEQQQWFIKSLARLSEYELKERYAYAKKVRNTGVICNFLAWNKAKKICL